MRIIPCETKLLTPFYVPLGVGRLFFKKMGVSFITYKT
jgi:hypothetical protein